MGFIKDKSLILSRIKSHYDLKSNADLARFLGIAPNTVSNWYTRNSIDYELIFSKCEDLDLNSLLRNDLQLKEPVKEYVLRTDRREEIQSIPLYNLEAAAGLTKLFSNEHEILNYISIPNLPKSDGAVHITGDSMYPLLKSGDIVIYKRIHDIENGIFWGEMYLLSININDEDLTMVKYIQKSELGDEYIKLVSQNHHHAPKDVLLKNITALASVKASIRINSMT